MMPYILAFLLIGLALSVKVRNDDLIESHRDDNLKTPILKNDKNTKTDKELESTFNFDSKKVDAGKMKKIDEEKKLN
jgi:hypothetical protein